MPLILPKCLLCCCRYYMKWNIIYIKCAFINVYSPATTNIYIFIEFLIEAFISLRGHIHNVYHINNDKIPKRSAIKTLKYSPLAGQ